MSLGRRKIIKANDGRGGSTVAVKRVNTVVVSIGGVEHRIRGEASPEYIEGLAQMLDHQILAVQREYPHITKVRAAILVALNLADRLETMEKQYNDLVQLVNDSQ